MSLQHHSKTPHCGGCNKALGIGPRLIVNGWWRCPDCVYRDEHPDADLSERPSGRALPLQDETLFPVPTNGKRRTRA